jgi:Leucine-rich repeat (LRR) protein
MKKVNGRVEIEKRIVKANETGSLVLRNANLQEIPAKVLSDLPNLSILVLNHNQIAKIPEEIAKLAKLRHLQMSNCVLSDSSFTPVIKTQKKYSFFQGFPPCLKRNRSSF